MLSVWHEFKWAGYGGKIKFWLGSRGCGRGGDGIYGRILSAFYEEGIR